jgi:hypothetical protein
MKILQIFALVFIVWEVIKLFIMPFIWKQTIIEWAKTQGSGETSSPILKFIEYFYIVFVIALFFSHWWRFALLLTILSIITALTLFPRIKKNQPPNWEIRFIMLIDCILSIFILAGIYNPLDLWK